VGGEDVELTTHLIRLKPFKVNERLMAFAREELISKGVKGSEKAMVNSPRVVGFELETVQLAIKIVRGVKESEMKGEIELD